MLDADRCYAALRQRDPSADGLFFVAVRSTRIYCRPICPARLPLRRNVTFYATAAAAHAAGFRPCLRCRPESAPGSPAWIGSLASINRALHLIEDGVLAENSVEALSARLGMTARHLRRLFEQHVGVGPLAIEQTRRVNLAKKLLHETRLPLTDIAFAAGFGSVRRFNEVFLAMFDRPPSALRRASGAFDTGEPLVISITYRPPLDWHNLIDSTGCIPPLDLGAIAPGAAVALSPGDRHTLSARLTGVPLRALGRAIAETKRRVHGRFGASAESRISFQPTLSLSA